MIGPALFDRGVIRRIRVIRVIAGHILPSAGKNTIAGIWKPVIAAPYLACEKLASLARLGPSRAIQSSIGTVSMA